MAEIAVFETAGVKPVPTHQLSLGFTVTGRLSLTGKVAPVFHANFNGCNAQVDTNGCVQVTEDNGSI